MNDATLSVNTNIPSGSGLDYGFPLLVDTTGTIHTRDGENGIHSHTCANEENMNDGTKVGPTPTGNTPGMPLYAKLVIGEKSKKSVNFHTLITPAGNGVDMVVLIESIRAISEQFANTTYGFFLGKRVAYPFCSMDGLDAMLENGLWFIHNNLLILKKWHSDVNLLKEDVGNVPVWVKLHGVPVTAFSKDGLSAIATKLGTPLMLDSYTSDMCMQSWGRASIRKECPKNIGSGEAKNLKKPSQTPRGVLVGPKVGFQPAKQVYKPVSKKPTTNTSGNKKKNMDSTKEIERLIINGKVTFMDDEGKPLENVDSSGDYDNEDEVASVDNEMASFLASKKDGYGTNSLLEQWRETYENADYDYDPYDDDMYEGHEVPKKFQSICDNLDIKVRGRKKK
ncbi:putative reverse transcriptase domain-containing protein [Tanacetum coccineum]